MKVMILAAGFGTRLFPLTIDRTKPAIPFLGKPLIRYVVEYVTSFGFKEIVINLHHQPKSVIEALGDGSDFGVNIHYTLEEPNILGTAGALDNARHLLGDETFVVVNGKIITKINILEAIKRHRESGAIATMVLRHNIKRERFTEVYVEDGFLKGFGDFAKPLTAEELKDTTRDLSAPLMFTGIQILEPKVFDYIPRGRYSDIVPTFYNPALKKGEPIAVHITEEMWYELSTIQRYLDVSLELMDGANIQAGRNCTISGMAFVKDTIMWDNVTVSEGAHLYRTVIADNVVIQPGEHFENAAIVRADMVRNCKEIPGKAPAGYVQGENYVVPLIDYVDGVIR
ncbi:MAG: NDP-sugar synthase [Pyrinomonadaceae bacterium]|nr:NDP-sugar synthase [Pyrinomonadaceae bacterium]MCX7640484.1 NDP-sugar synthase [Pyrinomonadaceae bacterium]MDW8305181.1 NDP-sugar synthase [Acidobacteriota bacterium]